VRFAFLDFLHISSMFCDFHALSQHLLTVGENSRRKEQQFIRILSMNSSTALSNIYRDSGADLKDPRFFFSESSRPLGVTAAEIADGCPWWNEITTQAFSYHFLEMPETAKARGKCEIQLPRKQTETDPTFFRPTWARSTGISPPTPTISAPARCFLGRRSALGPIEPSTYYLSRAWPWGCGWKYGSQVDSFQTGSEQTGSSKKRRNLP